MFRGSPDDVRVGPEALRDADGRVRGVLVRRDVSFFESEWRLLTPAGALRLPIPPKSALEGLLGDRLIVSVKQDWRGFRAGDVIAYDFSALQRRPAAVKPRLVTRPGPTEAFGTVSLLKDRLLITGLHNVRGFARVYTPSAKGWRMRPLPLPGDVSVQVVDVSRTTNRAFLTVQGFLTPIRLVLADATTGAVDALKTMPDRFDASGMRVIQRFAVSADGTRVPYWLVLPKGAADGGPVPTLMFGYGGFEISKPPVYLPEVGALWLSRGGAYVIANIRGGGEFGPRWHDAALRENRQRAFDDFAAVARDLQAAGVTTPRRLGIYGRSNGGVLTSVSMTQHPELWNAVVIESPLIDMLRFHKLSAGASWIGEYGDPDVPADRAFIARYSAYQALAPGRNYPRAYITTNTQDDRVHPGHARKFAARLQALGYPVVYFEDDFGGHSYDADPAANAARWARHYVYLSQQLMD